MSRSVTSPLSRSSICTVCFAVAPGNGMWSVAQPVMAWWPATYSSSQSRSHRLT